MTEAVSEPEAPARGAAVRRNYWPVIGWACAIGAVALFLYSGVRMFDDTQREVRALPWWNYDARVDFVYFYSGAKMAWLGEANELYPEPDEVTFYPTDPVFLALEDEHAEARLIARGNYYNPPALAYLQSPLTSLGFHDAWYAFLVASAFAMAGWVFLAWRAGRHVPELALLLLGVATFAPLHEAVIMGHNTVFFLLALTAGLLAVHAGKPTLAGLALSVLALKPQWAILPGLFLLARREWRAFAVMAGCSMLIVFVPFLVTGLASLKNYIYFLRDASQIDLKDAPHMFSWNGFLFKLDGGPFPFVKEPLCDSSCWLYDAAHSFVPAPSAGLIYALIGLTTLPLFVVWWSRDYYLGAAATVIAMLLVSTHSVWYDWAMLTAAALFLILRPMSRGIRLELWGVLIALYLASAQSIAIVVAPDRHVIDWHRPGIFLLTPVAFASLVWIATVAWREGLLHKPEFRLPAFARVPPATPEPSP